MTFTVNNKEVPLSELEKITFTHGGKANSELHLIFSSGRELKNTAFTDEAKTELEAYYEQIIAAMAQAKP